MIRDHPYIYIYTCIYIYMSLQYIYIYLVFIYIWLSYIEVKIVCRKHPGDKQGWACVRGRARVPKAPTVMVGWGMLGVVGHGVTLKQIFKVPTCLCFQWNITSQLSQPAKYWKWLKHTEHSDPRNLGNRWKIHLPSGWKRWKKWNLGISEAMETAHF